MVIQYHTDFTGWNMVQYLEKLNKNETSVGDNLFLAERNSFYHPQTFHFYSTSLSIRPYLWTWAFLLSGNFRLRPKFHAVKAPRNHFSFWSWLSFSSANLPQWKCKSESDMNQSARSAHLGMSDVPRGMTWSDLTAMLLRDASPVTSHINHGSHIK